MVALKVILTVLFVIVCVALAVIVLLQEGKANGLGAISGAADTYWGKNKGRSMEGKLEKGTKLLVIAFFVFAILLNIPAISNPTSAKSNDSTDSVIETPNPGSGNEDVSPESVEEGGTNASGAAAE